MPDRLIGYPGGIEDRQLFADLVDLVRCTSKSHGLLPGCAIARAYVYLAFGLRYEVDRPAQVPSLEGD